jgi:hypothetical protein
MELHSGSTRQRRGLSILSALPNDEVATYLDETLEKEGEQNHRGSRDY